MSNLQDTLTGELIGLARATEGNTIPTVGTYKTIIDGLFTSTTYVNCTDVTILRQIELIKAEKAKLVPRCATCQKACSRNAAYDMAQLRDDKDDIRTLKSLFLCGLQHMATYAHHAHTFGQADETVNQFFCKGLFALGTDQSADELLALITELGRVNLLCIELLTTGHKKHPASE